MVRNKVYTSVNLLGLAIGIACTVLISLYTLDELSFDRFHPDADRIVRIVENQADQEGKITKKATSYGAMTPVLQTVFPDWKHISRIYPSSSLVSFGADKKFQEDKFCYADSSMLEMFGFKMLEGDPSSALDEPFTLVITQTIAKKFFGDQSPIGKVLTVHTDEGKNDYKVTGLLENVPKQSHLQFDYLASYSSLRTVLPWVNNWFHPEMYTYALLPEGSDIASIQTRLDDVPKNHLRPDLKESRSFHIQPITDIHLHSERESEFTANGDMQYVYIFAAIAAFILLIACINFMNLATANSIDRSKEVGMRKVLGAHRGQLVYQFLSESVMMTTIAMILAVGIVLLVLPLFNEFAGKNLAWQSFLNVKFLLAALGLLAFVGLLSGMYPAFYLSKFNPSQSLKGGGKTKGSSAGRLRKALVIFQFAISCSLIIGTAVIYSQLNYIQNKRLGFEKDQLVIIPLRDRDNQTNIEPFRKDIVNHPDIISASASSGLPAKGGYYGFPVSPKQAQVDSLSMAINFMNDHDHIKTMGMEVVAGRDFSEDFGMDASEGFIINEAAAQKMGWENPLNQELTLNYHYQGQVVKTGRVVGVVRDFHFNSLRKEVDPVIMHIAGGTYYNNNLVVRVSGHNLSETLSYLDKKWLAFNPVRPLEFSFMDEVFGEMYEKEQQLGKVAGTFSLLAVLIACMGLFGLAAFSAERRIREIGIRKVLGASSASIIGLLSKDFLKLVLVAFVLSAPLAYFLMNTWLESFAYRTQIGVGIFAVAGLIAVSIAFLTVSSQAFKASRTNPVDALRRE